MAFGRDLNLTAAEIEALAKRLSLLRLAGAGRIYAVSPRAWARFAGEVKAALAAYQAANPDQQGLITERLRMALSTRVPAVPFAGMLQAPHKLGGAVVDGGRVRLPTHSVRLAPADERLWARI